MGYKCKASLSEKFIQQFLDIKSDDGVIDSKYLENRIESYIENHHSIKYCPSTPSCGLAIRLTSDESTSSAQIKCQCGHKFCFGCLQAWHQPATCQMMEKWKKKVDSDNANLEWVEENSKLCPGCKYPIEKVSNFVISH
jgi:ariadne-1